MNFGAELKESRLALMETSQRAKCSRNPSPRPPQWFPWGRSPGGGALALLPQQMWPVQGWRGVAGGAALRLAAGPWDVAGPGLDIIMSPGLGSATSRRLPDSSGGH